MNKGQSSKIPDLEESWLALLKEEFTAPYFLELKRFLVSEKEKGKIIYPRGTEIFNAFNSTPFDRVKVVIIGQDPYHGPGQAHGLCFSVKKGIKPPPSLMNIFKELKNDLGMKIPKDGDLNSWASEGVLLLNAILTVNKGEAASHREKGWETFTDKAIKNISDRKEGVVFLLWGKYAQSKENIIDTEKHFILKAPHPSPFSVHSGFFGCRHFSKTNEILKSLGLSPINWGLE